MIVKSKKTGLEQELSIEEWENVKNCNLDRNFIVIDSQQSIKKKPMEFPEEMKIQEVQKNAEIITKTTGRKKKNI